jgi:glycosyltransferase involved in cell wall biosynthesis
LRHGRARLVADYGDAWGTNAMLDHLPGWRRYIDEYLESRFLTRVDAVSTSSEGIADGIRRRYGLPGTKVFVVPSHFVDLDEYKAIPRTDKPVLSIVYTGNIHYGTQNLTSLLEGVRHYGNKVELIFAGHVDTQLAALINSKDLNCPVEMKGPVGRQAVMELQRNASVLLLAGLRGSKQVPAKLYEYFAAGRPILCMAYEEDDPAAALIKKHHRGLVVSDTPEQISQAIGELLELHGKGRLDSSFFLGDIPEYSMTRATSNFLRVVLS